jgi:hypothetical protein
VAARLKTFVTSDGLTDYVVATTSRPKALAAWGSHQDLFKTGLAHETDDPQLVKAAAASPGEVLRRPASSRGALSKLKRTRPPKPAKPAGPSKAELRRVARLEARLEAADAAYERELTALEARRARLDREHEAERERLEAELTAARRAPE